jgi:dienelactone hydrolase
VATTALLCALTLAGCGGVALAVGAGPDSPAGSPAPNRSPVPHRARTPAHSGGSALSPGSVHSPALTPAGRQRAPFAVGERIVTFVDRSRRMHYPGRPAQPRTLVTVIRYPAAGPPSGTDLRDATPARAAGPFPLVVFGHGFAVTPASYAQLLQAWARAGYVVAAPIFPLENANAPGGPNENDLIHQPRDMRFVISRMLAAAADPHSPLAGMIAGREIAVTGQSDGGETALATAYDPYFLDRRVRAAVILSGAQIPGTGALHFPSSSPPLLATQGTADTINQPRFTNAFFNAAPRPKYLLRLLGAGHLAPYTGQQPQLSVIERVTIAFLDRYLTNGRRGIDRMIAAGDQPGVAQLEAVR